MKMIHCGKFDSAAWRELINKSADSEEVARMMVWALHCP